MYDLKLKTTLRKQERKFHDIAVHTSILDRSPKAQAIEAKTGQMGL